MLSYRHGFHAGNMADVFKHSVLFSFLKNYTKKEKPFTAFDLNGGSGKYNLLSAWSKQTGEAENGIIKILKLYEADKLPQPIPEDFKFYLDFCLMNYKDNFFYHGSPEIIHSFLKKESNLIVVDLHSSEFEKLKELYKNISNVHIHKRDYCEALYALTPPSPGRGEALRGFAFFDPSYEVLSDYVDIGTVIEKVRRKWNAGIFIIWYPILKRKKMETEILKTKLSSLKNTEVCYFEVRHDFDTYEDVSETSSGVTDEYGLCGSGIAIVNPNWGLEEKVKKIACYFDKIGNINNFVYN